MTKGHPVKPVELAAPPLSPDQDKLARAFYGALMGASTNGCTCQPCQVLRILHKKLTGDTLTQVIAALEEE